jgi:hypothetical protein
MDIALVMLIGILVRLVIPMGLLLLLGSLLNRRLYHLP